MINLEFLYEHMDAIDFLDDYSIVCISSCSHNMNTLFKLPRKQSVFKLYTDKIECLTDYIDSEITHYLEIDDDYKYNDKFILELAKVRILFV